jgi:hypothetical protein
MLTPSKHAHTKNGSEKVNVTIKKVHPANVHINPVITLFKKITSFLP